MARVVVNTYFMGLPAAPDVRGSCVCAVLVTDTVGRAPMEGDPYAVYVGIVAIPTTEDGRAQSAEWVAGLGTKMNYDKARFFFPNIKQEFYRG